MNRFGMGACAADAAAIAQAGPAAWLEEQAVNPNGAVFDSHLPSVQELLANIGRLREAKGDADARKDVQKGVRQEILDALGERFNQSVTTRAPFAERLALFWSNHFTVSLAGKPFMGPMVCAFENQAVRPHVFGRFEDMALATAQHPAMLLYLDNAQSVGPNSPMGQRRDKGLNENYARELMELHTLGVDGGYTQADVTEMAKILTGWTILPPKQAMNGQSSDDAGGFMYVDRMHEPGAHTLLGKSYTSGGQQQGLEAIHDIVSHPATAHHIATKLAVHFIADDPPPQAVAALANAFVQSGGDLPSVYRALIALPEVWQTPLPKVKTPYELVVSAFRLLNMPPDAMPFKKVFGSLALMDEKPFMALSPAGYADRAADWLSADALMTRIDWCHALAQKIPSDARFSPVELANAALGPLAKTATMEWIARAPTPTDGYALVLASAEFQRR